MNIWSFECEDKNQKRITDVRDAAMTMHANKTLELLANKRQKRTCVEAMGFTFTITRYKLAVNMNTVQKQQ